MIEIVKQLLKDSLQLGERADELTANSPLLGNIPELDSFAVVTVLTLFEEEFGVEIADDQLDADTFATVGSLAEFFEACVN